MPEAALPYFKSTYFPLSALSFAEKAKGCRYYRG